MDWSAICKSFLALLFGAALTAAGGCSDKLDTEDPGSGSGYLTLNFNISGSPSRGTSTMAGEDKYHENTFSTLDLFFYTTTADENTAAVLHHHASGLSGSSAQLGLGNFQDLIGTFKVIAIANCTETKNLDKPTIRELKEETFTKAEGTQAFRAKEAPSNFVMTNFDNPSEITFNEAEDASGTLTFKRVAAKIRVAIDLPESIEQDGKTWTPDLDDMRVYFTSGVHKARLDGKQEGLQLTDDDYYNIATSGQKETEDYYCARQLADGTEDKNKVEGMVDGETYKYVNALPLYTYPATWEDTMFETHQPTVIVVVAWETGAGDEKTYKPSYYAMPVNKAGKIVSNAYYYLRAKIGMMGSDSPLQPLEVDMECEIADWGSAEETTADIRPIRFLQFNQTAYNVYNEAEITIPFYSSHSCSLISVFAEYYTYAANSGEEKVNNSTFSPSSPAEATKFTVNRSPYKFTCSIDNNSNTITLNHDFFSANKRSRFYVILVVRHSDQGAGTEYEETLYVTLYPGIYIETELIESNSGALRNHDGYILVNGYGYAEEDTGMLKEVDGREGNASDSRALTTFTITQITQDEKDEWGWVIGDPRQRNINNLLSTASMASDTEILERWTNANYGGFYDGTATSGATGTRTNRHRYGSGLQTMWEYYPSDSPDWTINLTNGVWNVKQDYWSDVEDTPQYHRTLSYYYPAAEAQENGNIIAPKFTIVSYHAYANAGSSGNGKEVARRRCAAYQQYGYPAGRWRLPTYAEIQYIKKLQREGLILDVFGGSENWSAQGRVNANGVLSTTDNTAYTRCVYDNWYWEQVDAEGVSYNKIPDPDGSHTNWKKFHWGDRPKENMLTRSGEEFTVERYLEMHKGVRPVENNK